MDSSGIFSATDIGMRSLPALAWSPNNHWAAKGLMPAAAQAGGALAGTSGVGAGAALRAITPEPESGSAAGTSKSGPKNSGIAAGAR